MQYIIATAIVVLISVLLGYGMGVRSKPDE
jgi:hypothetical protein